jgi:hypothetical protein
LSGYNTEGLSVDKKYKYKKVLFKVGTIRNIQHKLRYYHSSQNNSRIFDVPHLIRTEEIFRRTIRPRHIGVHPTTGTGYEMGRSFADQCDVLCQQAV